MKHPKKPFRNLLIVAGLLTSGNLYAQMLSVVQQMESSGLLKRPDSAEAAAPAEPEEPKKTAKKTTRRRSTRAKKT